MFKNSFVFFCSEFVKSAWVDIERFKEQKDHDLREALISYAIMQISMCKKVSTVQASKIKNGLSYCKTSKIPVSSLIRLFIREEYC